MHTDFVFPLTFLKSARGSRRVFYAFSCMVQSYVWFQEKSGGDKKVIGQVAKSVLGRLQKELEKVENLQKSTNQWLSKQVCAFQCN